MPKKPIRMPLDTQRRLLPVWSWLLLAITTIYSLVRSCKLDHRCGTRCQDDFVRLFDDTSTVCSPLADKTLSTDEQAFM